VHESLKNLVERLHEAASGNLESVILYGSAAGGHLVEAHADLNVLCILKSLGLEDLRRVAGVASWWTDRQKQPPLLFFTAQELRQSADVFAIELIDMQQNHRVLYGSDVVAGISIPMNLHRVQLEHDLRTLLLKLRQHFVRNAEKEGELAAVLAKSSSSVLTLLRHLLIAFKEPVPATPEEVFQRIATLTGADANALGAGLALRKSDAPDANLLPRYGAHLAALEKVVSMLDRHLPKKDWQRVGSSSK
jgi:hypothetical protein